MAPAAPQPNALMDPAAAVSASQNGAAPIDVATLAAVAGYMPGSPNTATNQHAANIIASSVATGQSADSKAATGVAQAQFDASMLGGQQPTAELIQAAQEHAAAQINAVAKIKTEVSKTRNTQ